MCLRIWCWHVAALWLERWPFICILLGWRSNQDWRCICADTVYSFVKSKSCKGMKTIHIMAAIGSKFHSSFRLKWCEQQLFFPFINWIHFSSKVQGPFTRKGWISYTHHPFTWSIFSPEQVGFWPDIFLKIAFRPTNNLLPSTRHIWTCSAASLNKTLSIPSYIRGEYSTMDSIILPGCPEKAKILP